MRIGCPNCSAEYEVPETLLASGPRLLRCARCGHRFEAALPVPAAAPEVVAPPPPAEVPAPSPPPPAPEAAAAPVAQPAAPRPPEPQAAPEPPAIDPDRPPPTRGLRRHSPIDPPPLRRAPPPEPEGSPVRLALAWLLSFALLGAAGWATWHYHAEIVAFWPPAARLYETLGIN